MLWETSGGRVSVLLTIPDRMRLDMLELVERYGKGYEAWAERAGVEKH